MTQQSETTRFNIIKVHKATEIAIGVLPARNILHEVFVHYTSKQGENSSTIKIERSVMGVTHEQFTDCLSSGKFKLSDWTRFIELFAKLNSELYENAQNYNYYMPTQMAKQYALSYE
jgi:hypothetical protein